MNKNFHVIIAISVTLILSASIFSFITLKQNNKLSAFQESCNKLELNYNALKENYGLLKSKNTNLTSQILDLNLHNEQLINESGLLSKKISHVEDEVEATLDKFEDFEIKVHESMEWFTENSNLANSDQFDEIKWKLKEKCIHNTSDNQCRIDLTCIYNVNKQNSIWYRTDIAATGEEDILQSLDSIYSNHGGDCDDYAFLFTAEFNFLVDQCLISGFERDRIISLADDKSISGNYLYPVCGNFDPGRRISSFGGHCVVALSNKKINDSFSIYNSIKDAQLVEPQTGEFMFDMNNTEETSIFYDGQSPDTLYYIWYVITNDDLKIFYSYSDKAEWIGYTNFLDDIQGLKRRLEK